MTKQESEQTSAEQRNPTQRKKKRKPLREDASRKEVILYAFGNIEAAIADQFFIILQNVMVIAMHVNPLLLGLILGIKTLWDGITDPVMAHITDNTKSRWGRRRPYILIGGVSRILLLVAIVGFMPKGAHMTTNVVMESQKHVNETVTEVGAAQKSAVQTYEQISTAEPDVRQMMISMISDIPATTLAARDTLATHLETLKQDVLDRQIEADEKQREAKLAEEKYAGQTEFEKERALATGVAELSAEKVTKAENLVSKGIDAEHKAIAAGYATLHILVSEGLFSFTQIASPEGAQKRADQAYEEAGLKPLNIFDLESANLGGGFKNLLSFGKNKRRKKIALNYAAYHSYVKETFLTSEETSTPELAQTAANQTYAAAGLEPLKIFSIVKGKPPAKWKKKSAMDNIKAGVNEFFEPRNDEQRKLIIYVLFAFLLFTTLTTVQAVPYYALGIELSPSYDGRTQVVTYRAVMNKIAGLVQPWVPVFCFSLLFSSAIEGLFWIAILACIIGIPSTVLMCWFTKERTHFKPKKDHPNIFKSMWSIAHNWNFLRIFALYTLVGMTIGIFMQLGFYLNVYWVMGSALSGAKLGAYVSMLAWGLGLFMLPVINWGCRKFEKHNFLRFAIIWMAIGAALHWWCMNPLHPEYQFILPFFYSVGIGAVFTVLPTMMADVTDVDELRHNVRREGMFGAVMAFLMKLTGTLTPILSGVVLAMSGFDATLEYEQMPSTILHLRLLYSFIPAGMLLISLLVLIRYPLTRAKVQEIKKELDLRHEAEEAAETTV